MLKLIQQHKFTQKIIFSEQSQAEFISMYKSHNKPKQRKKFELNIYFQSIKKIKHLTHVLNQLNFGLNNDLCNIISEYWTCNTIIASFDGTNGLRMYQSKNELDNSYTKYNNKYFSLIWYSHMYSPPCCLRPFNKEWTYILKNKEDVKPQWNKNICISKKSRKRHKYVPRNLRARRGDFKQVATRYITECLKRNVIIPKKYRRKIKMLQC